MITIFIAIFFIKITYFTTYYISYNMYRENTLILMVFIFIHLLSIGMILYKYVFSSVLILQFSYKVKITGIQIIVNLCDQYVVP